MKLIIPLVTILLLTSTLSLTACSQVEQRSSEETTSSPSEVAETISAFRVGLNGEYDQSGLAKRVAKALAEESELSTLPKLRAPLF